MRPPHPSRHTPHTFRGSTGSSTAEADGRQSVLHLQLARTRDGGHQPRSRVPRRDEALLQRAAVLRAPG
eukprot:3759808-Pyramimonas_sp.AAC.1